MLLLNFAHPLTPAQREQLARVLDTTEPIRVVEISTHFDQERSFAEQTRALVEGIGLTPQQWQAERILVNLPSLNVIAACILAELHGRMGYWPPVVRLRPVKDALPPQFEVAEVLNLQAIRESARAAR